MMTSEPRGKLIVTITLKCDELLAEKIDARQRERERETGVPLSRSLIAREILDEWFEWFGIRYKKPE